MPVPVGYPGFFVAVGVTVGVPHLRRRQGVGDTDGVVVGVGDTTMAVKKAGEVRLHVWPDGLVKIIWTSTT